MKSANKLHLRRVRHGGNWVWGVFEYRRAGPLIATSWTFTGACQAARSWSAMLAILREWERLYGTMAA